MVHQWHHELTAMTARQLGGGSSSCTGIRYHIPPNLLKRAPLLLRPPLLILPHWSSETVAASPALPPPIHMLPGERGPRRRRHPPPAVPVSAMRGLPSRHPRSCPARSPGSSTSRAGTPPPLPRRVTEPAAAAPSGASWAAMRRSPAAAAGGGACRRRAAARAPSHQSGCCSSGDRPSAAAARAHGPRSLPGAPARSRSRRPG